MGLKLFGTILKFTAVVRIHLYYTIHIHRRQIMRLNVHKKTTLYVGKILKIARFHVVRSGRLPCNGVSL